MAEDWEIDETEESEEQEQDVLAYQISSYPAVAANCEFIT